MLELPVSDLDDDSPTAKEGSGGSNKLVHDNGGGLGRHIWDGLSYEADAGRMLMTAT